MARFFGVPMRNGVALGVASTLPMRGGLPVPALNLDFLSGSLDSRITFTRGSQATLFDSTGALVYARHNLATNSESISAFGSTTNASLTSAAISTPLPSVTTAGLLVLNVGANTGNSADGVTVINTVNLPTQTQVTYSAFVKAAGTTTFRLRSNVTGSVFSFTLSGTGTAPTPSSDLQSATISALSDSWYRVAWTFTTTTGAPGARADYWTWKTDTANGIAGVYITGVQINITAMEGGVTSSLSTYYPTVASAYYAPRFDTNPSTLAPLGLLIEEQRTNSIRNNTMQGAVAGTPGTLPTNWGVFTSLTGLTREVVGTGTEDGITYIDIRLSGTPSAAGTYAFYTETSTGVAALNAQTWTNSAYFKLQAGSLTGILAVRLYFQENNSSGNYLTEQNTGIANPTSAALSTQRASATRTLNQATTAFLMPGFNLLLTGAAIDITLRIGLPQLEQGAFATSVIPTTTTALTRNADVASMTGTNFSSWYNAAEGALLCVGVTNASSVDASSLVISDGTNNNRIQFSTGGLNTVWNPFVVTSGSSVATLTQSAAQSPKTNPKLALAYKVNDFAATTAGVSATTDTSGNVPVVNRLLIGAIGSGAVTWNSHIQRIAYYPRRLPDSTLQALTA